MKKKFESSFQRESAPQCSLMWNQGPFPGKRECPPPVPRALRLSGSTERTGTDRECAVQGLSHLLPREGQPGTRSPAHPGGHDLCLLCFCPL